MLSKLSRPAVRRKLAAFFGFRRVPLLLLACLSLASSWAAPAPAHEGHEHEPPPAAATAVNRPRLVTQSEIYELVAVLEGERLTIYLDRFEDNTPVSDAKIEVAINGETVAAEPAPEGAYVVSSQLLSGHGSVEIIFDIRATAGDDLLIGNLVLAGNGNSAEPGAISGYEQAWAALRHGAQDHLALLALALLLGTAFGIGLRWRWRSRLTPMLLVAALAVIAFGAAAQTMKKGANGGDVVVVDGHPIEFVSKDNEITFYILDEDGQTPVSTTGLTGRAVVQDAGKTTAVSLSGAEPNKFVGQLQVPLGSKARVVFSAKVAGHNLQARFTTN